MADILAISRKGDPQSVKRWISKPFREMATAIARNGGYDNHIEKWRPPICENANIRATMQNGGREFAKWRIS